MSDIVYLRQKLRPYVSPNIRDENRISRKIEDTIYFIKKYNNIDDYMRSYEPHINNLYNKHPIPPEQIKDIVKTYYEQIFPSSRPISEKDSLYSLPETNSINKRKQEYDNYDSNKITGGKRKKTMRSKNKKNRKTRSKRTRK